MADFLQSIGYNGWVLPALLVIPTIGALLVWLHGFTLRGASEEAAVAGAMTARRLTLAILVLEFLVSIGLWWSFDVSSAGWQAAVDWPWIDSWAKFIAAPIVVAFLVPALVWLIALTREARGAPAPEPR